MCRRERCDALSRRDQSPSVARRFRTIARHSRLDCRVEPCEGRRATTERRGLMYLFSRQAQLAPGNTRAAMTWATGITEKVNQITGLEVSLFSLTFSPRVGTLAWSTFVPDLPTLEVATDKLLVDDGYVSMVDAGAKYGE